MEEEEIRAELGLTRTQYRVFRFLVLTDHGGREIADLLNVAPKTVKFHISNIYQILQVKNRAGLMLMWHKMSNSMRHARNKNTATRNAD